MSDIEWLASEFVRLGITNMFGIPGEGASLELLTEMERLGSRFHLVGHEGTGALMAGGYGRISGVPGISISIKGPGLTNMLSGIAANWFDHNPAISVSESYGPGSNPYRMHKRLRHSDVLRPLVKAFADNTSPRLFASLFDISLSEEPGPIHLDISGSMSQSRFDCYTSQPKQTSSLPAEAIRLIRNSQKPVIIAGALATRRIWREKLAELSLPIFTTVAGKGAIDETLPHSVGVFTNSGGPFSPERKILPMADLIVGFGLRTSEIIDVKPLPCQLIIVDELPGKAEGLGAIVEVCADLEQTAEALGLFSSKIWGDDQISAARTILNNRVETDRWLPAVAYKLAQRTLPPSTRFLLDTGNFCIIAEHALTARTPLSVMGSSCGRSMGVALPAAIGAALASPKTPLVVIIGDGGIAMYPDSIRVGVKEKLPQLILLMRDGFLSSVRREALKKHGSGDFLRVQCSSWTGVFESFGCPAERIESATAFENALRSWDLESGPLFLELSFNSDEYMAMTDGIR